MLRFLRDTGWVFSVIFLCSTFVFAEDITITTYYPSPYGVYRELRAQRTAIGDNYIDGANYTWEAADGDGGEVDYRADLVVEGAVGIGTTNPGLGIKLGVEGGNVNVSGGGVYLENSHILAWSGGSTHISGDGVGGLGLSTNGSTRLYINSSGNVGIGTTGPAYKLQLSTDSAAKPNTNTWTIVSDQRIKKNILDFTDGLNVIMKLKPHTYQYNGLGGQGYDDTDTHIGFVAQEVESIAPYMVETREGTIDGAQVSDFKSYQGHALPFILLNSIQEQQKIIQAQQLEIDKLKARLDKLERKQI
jgi:hypothetical protein